MPRPGGAARNTPYGRSRVAPQIDVAAAGALTCRWARCGRQFANAKALWAHVGNHAADWRRPVCMWADCTRGGVPLSCVSALVRHARNHTGACKPVGCPVGGCATRFDDCGQMRRHCRLTHRIDNTDTATSDAAALVCHCTPSLLLPPLPLQLQLMSLLPLPLLLPPLLSPPPPHHSLPGAHMPRAPDDAVLDYAAGVLCTLAQATVARPLSDHPWPV